MQPMINLTGILRGQLVDGIGRKRPDGHRFCFGHYGIITVGRRRGREYHAFHSIAACGFQDIQATLVIGPLAAERVINGSRHGGERCFMENDIHTIHCLAHCIKITDITR